MKLKILALTVMTSLSVNAQSAEIQILQRESLEAERYATQITAQAKAINHLQEQACRLARKSKTAYTNAIKRQEAYGALIASEQAVADTKVYLKEYSHTDYNYLPSDKETEARLIGVNK